MSSTAAATSWSSGAPKAMTAAETGDPLVFHSGPPRQHPREHHGLSETPAYTVQLADSLWGAQGEVRADLRGG